MPQDSTVDAVLQYIEEDEDLHTAMVAYAAVILNGGSAVTSRATRMGEVARLACIPTGEKYTALPTFVQAMFNVALDQVDWMHVGVHFIQEASRVLGLVDVSSLMIVRTEG